MLLCDMLWLASQRSISGLYVDSGGLLQLTSFCFNCISVVKSQVLTVQVLRLGILYSLNYAFGDQTTPKSIMGFNGSLKISQKY